MVDDNNSKRGTKRIGYETPKEKNVGTKVAGKLHHDLKEVKKAAKKAKTFETQKLVKKLKVIRCKDGSAQEINDLEAQLTALRDTDHEAIANVAFKTKLNKDRILSENEHVQAAISNELILNLLGPAIAGTPTAKVQSRLLSSKVLATEVAAAIEDLRTTIQPKTDLSHEVTGDSADEGIIERPKKMRKVVQTGDDHMIPGNSSVERGGDEESLGYEEGEGEMDEDGWESGTVGDDEKELDDDGESGSLTKELIGSSEEEDGEDDNVSECGSEEGGLLVKPSVSKQPNLTTAKGKAKTATTRSTFLPSLAVGYIRGGSDESDWSDSEAKVADIDQKKNRRGQRARRAIWEKKYGRNANHKKRESDTIQAFGRGVGHRPDTSATPAHTNHPRNRGIPSKAVPTPRGRKGRSNAPPLVQLQTDSGWGQRSRTQRGAAATPRPMVQQTGRREERPLHPSWEAKKRLKEKQNAGILPSQGTKIKF